MPVKENIVVENARIAFRNFKGAAGKFNPEGNRNFCVFLDPEIAPQLEEEGWNIRWLKPRDEGDIHQPYMQVSVSYDNYPPKIVLISGQGKTILEEDTVNILDWADIDNVDVIIRPYNWEVNGKHGVKAYVKNMYVTILEDEFESKYYDVPDSAQNCIGPDCDLGHGTF